MVLDVDSDGSESSPPLPAEDKIGKSFFISQDCLIDGISSPIERVPFASKIKSSGFHAVLLDIRPGNVEELQAIANYCGMNIKVLTQYHAHIVHNAWVEARDFQTQIVSNILYHYCSISANGST